MLALLLVGLREEVLSALLGALLEVKAWSSTGRPGKLLSIARRPRCLLVRSGNLVQSLHSAADARVDERELEPIMALRDSSYDRSLLCS